MPASPLEPTGTPGDLRISITTDNEVRYWTKTLNCTEEQLRVAISIVGLMVNNVRKYLRFNT